jgi:hypothetical protein
LKTSASQVDLLANVGALLADTQSLLTRLQDGDGGEVEDGGFFAADTPFPLREPSPLPPERDACPQSALDEITTEEFYEFQVISMSESALTFKRRQNQSCQY